MINMSLKIETRKVAKRLHAIQRNDIPGAKRAAWKRAGAKVNTEVATYLYNSLGVQKWQRTGVLMTGLGGGQRKGKGSRISVTGYNKRIDGISVYLRTRGLNPLGTKYKDAKYSENKGKKRKWVRASGRKYNGRRVPGRWLPGYILDYDKSPLPKAATIPFTAAHRLNAARIAKQYGMKTFKKRFEHEFNRRLGRRGSR